MHEFGHEFMHEFKCKFLQDLSQISYTNLCTKFIQIPTIFLHEKLVMLRMACTVLDLHNISTTMKVRVVRKLNMIAIISLF